MRWTMIEAQARGQCVELAIGHVVAQQTAGERAGVDPLIRQRRPVAARQRGIEEAEVEAHVVTDDDGVTHEFEKRGEHGVDARRSRDHRLCDAGEHGDLGRDRAPGVDERLEGTEGLATTDFDGADLGDRAVVRRPAGGLEVEHAEGHLGQRGPEIVEGSLQHAHQQ